ncbi:MAG: hypothetical protein M1114_04800 [Candidatus Dependentiae bacterium]|nr:hypothetical protein [Candidatus Dependentiae bacterium]
MDQKTFAQGISDILVKQSVISAQEADDLQKSFAQSSHDWFVEFLLEEDLVDKEDILKALSTYYKVPFFDVEGYFFDHLLVRDFPKDFLLRHNIIPVEIDQDILVFVASDPSDQSLLSNLRKYTDDDIQFYVGIARDIEDAVKEYYDKSITDDYDLVEAEEPEEEENDQIREIEEGSEEEE